MLILLLSSHDLGISSDSVAMLGSQMQSNDTSVFRTFTFWKQISQLRAFVSKIRLNYTISLILLFTSVIRQFQYDAWNGACFGILTRRIFESMIYQNDVLFGCDNLPAKRRRTCWASRQYWDSTMDLSWCVHLNHKMSQSTSFWSKRCHRCFLAPSGLVPWSSSMTRENCYACSKVIKFQIRMQHRFNIST